MSQQKTAAMGVELSNTRQDTVLIGRTKSSPEIELKDASERCCRDRFAKEFDAMLTVLGEKRGLLHFSTQYFDRS